MNKRCAMLLVLVAGGAVFSTMAAVAYAAQCPGGPVTEGWGLERVSVTVDGQELEDQSEYEDLQLGVSSIASDDGGLRLSIRYADDPRSKWITFTHQEGHDNDLQEDEL